MFNKHTNKWMYSERSIQISDRTPIASGLPMQSKTTGSVVLSCKHLRAALADFLNFKIVNG